MKKLRILSIVALGAILGGCGAETPFTNTEEAKGVGQFSKGALDLDIKIDNLIHQTRSKVVDAKDFNVEFFDAETGNSLQTYKYGEMPEVINLNAGKYRIEATYGEDHPAKMENPYYKGVSKDFTVSPKAITSDIGKISCELQNLKATVVFDPALKNRMSDDAYVEVKINENSTNILKFGKEHDAGVEHPEEDEVAGYFKVQGESTLVATFYGEIDGAMTSETKTLTGVKSGHHYRITFRRHEHNGEDSGHMGSEINVDASVTAVDINRGVPLIEDEDLGDDERPKEDPDQPDDPNVPDNPGMPTISAKDPALKLDKPNTLVEGLDCTLDVSADKGIKEMTVLIQMDNMPAADLVNMGLGDLKQDENGKDGCLLNLTNPKNDTQAGQIKGFGFPCGDEIIGETEISFSISSMLLDLMSGLGAGTNTFTITVVDNDGNTVKKALILVVK